MTSDLAEQLALERKRLGRRLDHQVTGGELGQLGGGLQARDRMLRSLLAQPATLGAAAQLRDDPLRAALQCGLVGVVEQRPRPRLAAQLGDPGAHRSGACDPDPRRRCRLAHAAARYTSDRVDNDAGPAGAAPTEPA